MAEPARRVARGFLGLGANLGEPAAQLHAALRRIAALPETVLQACSTFYRSDPIGPPGQPDYCNAVCAIETGLAPLHLLDALQAIEVEAGRRRDGIRWAARRLDIDILHLENTVCDTARLHLPHPQIARRNWVLVPLAEIAPTLEIPGLGVVGELAHAIGNTGLEPWS